MASRTLSRAERDAADLTRRETVEQLHQQLAEGLAKLDNKDAWQRYLSFARGFPQYSMGNQILVLLAKPNATAVAGYRAWQAKGRQVRRVLYGGEWWFSVVDVVGALTNSPDPGAYLEKAEAALVGKGQ